MELPIEFTIFVISDLMPVIAVTADPTEGIIMLPPAIWANAVEHLLHT